MVEIDAIDYLMTYGIVGVLIAYGFVVFVMLSSLANRNNFSGFLIFISLLLMAISLTAGHVWNSGTAGIFIAALFAMAMSRCKTNENTLI